MLMITVMAFATDYTDQLTFKLTVGSNSSEKSLPQGTLTIEKRVDGTYNVTASGCDFSAADFGNWGDISCDGVAGTTNADGLTTIEVSKPEVFANGSVPSGYSLSGQSLLVKFNGTKAYALLKGKLALNAIVGYPFEYTFGTDKGFDGGSTGGGETGGETSSVVTVLENFKNDGNRFNHSFKIDWDKQKVVMSIDPTSCGNDLEHIVGLGVDCTQWDEALHVYNKYFDRYGTPAQTYNRQMLQAYFQMPGNNNNTGVFDRKSPFSIEVSKDKGFVVDGEVKISASQMTSLFAQANLTVGSGQGGDAASHALYKYIKVVPLNWTEVPPVTVLITKKFNDVDYSNTWSQAGTANVTFEEMSDETVKMKFATDGINISANALTKGTDAKNRTTYTGDAVNDAMPTLTYTIKAVVYEKDNVSRLYMTMKATNMNIVVGENPDTEVQKPVVYKNTLKVVRGTDTKTYENAEVSVLAKGEGMYEVTLPKFSDMDNVPGEWGPITFQAKGVEENGKVVLTATDQEFTLTNTGWKNDVVKVSMKGEIESEMLKATFNVNHSSMSGYNYTLYYGVEAPEVVTEESNKTYKSNLRIADQTSEDENAYLFQTDEATVNIIKYSDKTYKITLKQITLNSKTSDLVFTGKAVESEVDPGEGGVVETEGTMVQATADAETQNFLGGAVNAQFMWQDVSDTEIRMSFVLEGKTLSLGGEFNYENTPTFPMENYQADGKGFVVSTDIDWSKQKFQAIIDATKCNAANTEDIFGFGAEATAWFKNIHVYADKGSYKAYFQPAAEKDNNNTTVTIADQSNITIEVSKAKGLTVDGVVVIAAEQLTGIFDLTTVKFGSGENSQYSNALYKSVKLVDLPKDPETGINAISAEVANGEAQLFTVNGVKLNKLQKGLNIVRTADGKVKKVLVK